MQLVARCALTFLPILEPGCSKHCTMCKREFINEEKFGLNLLKPSATSTSEDGPARPSLAAFLFDEFDVCPYCGGKYFE